MILKRPVGNAVEDVSDWPFIFISACLFPFVLSTRQTPFVLPRSRKTSESLGAGHGPGPLPHGRVFPCRSR